MFMHSHVHLEETSSCVEIRPLTNPTNISSPEKPHGNIDHGCYPRYKYEGMLFLHHSAAQGTRMESSTSATVSCGLCFLYRLVHLSRASPSQAHASTTIVVSLASHGICFVNDAKMRNRLLHLMSAMLKNKAKRNTPSRQPRRRILWI